MAVRITLKGIYLSLSSHIQAKYGSFWKGFLMDGGIGYLGSCIATCQLLGGLIRIAYRLF